MIAVSLNYRLQCWGFMWSKEILEEGVANLGFRDQRLALHWIQENIAAVRVVVLVRQRLGYCAYSS